MILLPDREVVVIDIETTDVALAETARRFAEPVEIGAVVLNAAYEAGERFEMVIRPQSLESFTEFSAGLTGLTRADLEKAPLFENCWRDFADFVGFNRRKLVAWGAPFDYAVLRQAYLKMGMSWPHAYPMIDALSMVYRAAGEWGFRIPRWSLKSACERFGVPIEKKHRALGGAMACASVLKALAEFDGTREVSLY
jgi:DNA polymerase III epsilon subunit-like protein